MMMDRDVLSSRPVSSFFPRTRCTKERYGPGRQTTRPGRVHHAILPNSKFDANLMRWWEKTYNEGATLFFICLWQMANGIKDLDPSVEVDVDGGGIVRAFRKKIRKQLNLGRVDTYTVARAE
jgi:hypothetical protein